MGAYVAAAWFNPNTTGVALQMNRVSTIRIRAGVACRAIDQGCVSVKRNGVVVLLASSVKESVWMIRMIDVVQREGGQIVWEFALRRP
jgi:hypothetical protein